MRRATKPTFFGLLGLLVLVLAPAGAGADPQQPAFLEAVLPVERQVLDDESLSNVRGRGHEGPELSAPAEVAVILWDELKQRQHQGQRSAGYSQTLGSGNLQSTGVVLQRY